MAIKQKPLQVSDFIIIDASHRHCISIAVVARKEVRNFIMKRFRRFSPSSTKMLELESLLRFNNFATQP